MPGIFILTGVLALAAIVLLLTAVPNPPSMPAMARAPFSAVLLNGQLARMNFGVLALHMMQTALWVVVPPLLTSTGGLPVAEHWKVYLPAVLVSFVIMVPAIIAAEKRGHMKAVLSSAIVLLILMQLGLALTSASGSSVWAIGGWLPVFFIGFNILEAIQPSLISRLAPGAAKGTALGVYNTTQSLGLFLGGALGGWLLKHHGALAVQAFCAGIGGLWLLLALSMTMPDTRVAKPASSN